MDLHSPQIQGFFHVPVDNLYALPVLCDRIQQEDIENPVVVSPDVGFAKPARLYATRLGAPLAIADKERTAHDERASVLSLIGDVEGKTAIVVDDFTISGGTLADVARMLVDRGAGEVFAAVTHGVLAEGSMPTIDASPIRKLIITDTVENQPVSFSEKVEVVSVAPLLGEAIRRIHDRQSISAMFPE
jgi:ribose-phosphate pyrophosphokinase